MTRPYARICAALAFLVCSGASAASSCRPIPNKQLTDIGGALSVLPDPFLCVGGRKYSIIHAENGRTTSLKWPGHTRVLHRVPKGFEPSLVGAEKLIGFLPDYLQTHKARKIVFYISTIRTRGGDGGGQCGAGSEIFINALDLKPQRPKILASHLIGSCSGIEIDDSSLNNLGKLTVANAKLHLNFIRYPKQGDMPRATLSSDFKRLEFAPKTE